ncbi:hypothetical protein HYH03_000195 [Edaphochlamys debaryana]|uniref:RRM domain-containing protein n=1 Tax=Edaphochlamys debaryana TaxID=47281 RepID=A0A835YFE0_9CHLO|nr:hypothetical protein HYH03_000195 [Edaphochlamys debaryana]|eukprot:KAG2501693.1 hypothetical protein HYH03_000195 [Edaphochlamys debaryana]
MDTEEAGQQEAPAPPSSRLCVKNMPKYVDEARLKEFFSVKGEVTDVKVLRTKDGRSRQLGFIGFKTEEGATAALRYFNRSYMDTMRLSVEYARKVGDHQLPRAWSKHTPGTSANKKLAGPEAGAGAGAKAEAGKGDAGKGDKGKEKGKAKPKPGDEEIEDPKLREFLALMAPRSRARIWGNDELEEGADATAAAAAVRASTAERQRQAALAKRARRAAAGSGSGGEGSEDGEGSSGEEDNYQDWTAAGAGAAGRGGGRGRGGAEDAAMLDAGAEEDDAEGEEEEEDEEEEERGPDEVVVNEAVSDLDYLRARMRRWDEDDDAEGDDGGAGRDQGPGGKAAAKARGDQSGVGTSPRCAADGAAAAAAGPKKAKKADAAAGKSKSKQPGADADGDGDGGGGPEDADVEMADADGAGPGRGKGWPAQGAAAAAGGEDDEGLMDTGRLFVRNLAYSSTEAELEELFRGMGEVASVHLVLDRETKRSKGLAYVQYVLPEDAARAAQQLDGTIHQGRLLHILPARRAHAPAPPLPSAPAPDGNADGSNPDGSGRPGPPGTSSFKAEREAQRKADAGNRAAWNTLFMRPDTVAEAVAAHYGLTKQELLDPGAPGSRGGRAGDSVAVRMALGEAQVIAATKQALADAGVSVEALERAAAASGKASATKTVARSATALLVKNLPFSADEEELAAMFGRCGPVARLVLPPAKAMAVVEFTEPQDARSAFRSLAYKKYHHVPLYLEWAPADLFSTPPPARPQPAAAAAAAAAPDAQAKKAGGKGAKAAAPDATSLPELAPHPEADPHAAADTAAAAATAPAAAGTIYVKNLAFATTDPQLKKHFAGAVAACKGQLHSAVVARRKAKDGALQSLGYGFVEVNSEAVAQAVIKQLQGSMLGGHKLALALSAGRKDAGAGGAPKAKKGGAGEEGSTKLVVRNLAFEATKKDIQGMFNPFGHLKSCRLPKKFDGSHRGFAFVEFVTKQEARNAMEGVGGTHLYGRRLVVEYAREDEGVEEIRAKTAAKFKRDEELAAGAAPAKKLKL